MQAFDVIIAYWASIRIELRLKGLFLWQWNVSYSCDSVFVSCIGLTLCPLGNFACFLVVDWFFQNQLFWKNILEILAEILLGLIWVQTVCIVIVLHVQCKQPHSFVFARVNTLAKTKLWGCLHCTCKTMNYIFPNWITFYQFVFGSLWPWHSPLSWLKSTNQNMDMLHIKIKVIYVRQHTSKHFSHTRTPTPEWVKRSKQLFLKMVILHIKLQEMTRIILCKQSACP